MNDTHGGGSVCPSCGIRVAAGAKFCGGCGTALSGGQAIPPPAPPPPPRPSGIDLRQLTGGSSPGGGTTIGMTPETAFQAIVQKLQQEKADFEWHDPPRTARFALKKKSQGVSAKYTGELTVSPAGPGLSLVQLDLKVDWSSMVPVIVTAVGVALLFQYLNPMMGGSMGLITLALVGYFVWLFASSLPSDITERCLKGLPRMTGPVSTVPGASIAERPAVPPPLPSGGSEPVPPPVPSGGSQPGPPPVPSGGSQPVPPPVRGAAASGGSAPPTSPPTHGGGTAAPPPVPSRGSAAAGSPSAPPPIPSGRSSIDGRASTQSPAPTSGDKEAEAETASVADRIKQLASLLEVGAITQEEYAAKKAELLKLL